MKIRLLNTAVSSMLSAPLMHWLQPPWYAGIAIGALVYMVVHLYGEAHR